MRVLFVCSRNRWRSLTAEHLFRNEPDLQVRSVGTAKSARRRLSQADLDWAALVIVMEHDHAKQIRRQLTPRAPLVVLRIPDRYPYMDDALVALLQERVPPIIAEHRRP